MARTIWILVGLGLTRCGPPAATPTVQTPAVAAPTEETPTAAPPTDAEIPTATAPACAAPIPLFADGVETERVCPAQAQERGLTLIDLSDEWAPQIFAEAPELGDAGHQPYRDVYVALANERLDDVPRGYSAERFLELYGIEPSLGVVHSRLSDDARHQCHSAIDNAGLGAVTRTLTGWAGNTTTVTSRVRQATVLRNRLERERERRGVADFAALSEPQWQRQVLQLAELEASLSAVRAVQGHLRCDEAIPPRTRITDAIFDWNTVSALRTWQQRHAIVGNGALDADTRTLMLEASRELDFRALLRALRERVVDATGVIEDGSAGHSWGQVLGRQIDHSDIHFDGRQPPANNPAPDLVSHFTEVAATALGLRDAESATRSLTSLRTANVEQVLIALPAVPTYHSEHMELRAEVDRGDVWHSPPYLPDGTPRGSHARVRPVLTLYARDASGTETALIRWPTTIGGWKPELDENGVIGLKYKESYAGPRVWRDVVASPAWLPPPGTPDDELIKRVGGRLVANHALFGPGYRSAYGLAMMVLNQVFPAREEGGEPIYGDQGIRAHGSVSYRSITNGTSHGCHRLYNHLAVRLAGFLVAHRHHTRHGSIPVLYERTASDAEGSVTFRIQSRGYRYELTPPVPVEVLPGNIRGPERAPTGFFPLPEEAAAQATAEAAADG